MNNVEEKDFLRSDLISFRTDAKTKALIAQIAHERGMTNSDLLNTIVKNGIDENGNFILGLKEEQFRLKSEILFEEKLQIEKAKIELEKQIDLIKNTPAGLNPKSKKDRKILVIHNLYLNGVREIHENELEKYGISGWFDLGFTRSDFGPYSLKKMAFSSVWRIEKLV